MDVCPSRRIRRGRRKQGTSPLGMLSMLLAVTVTVFLASLEEVVAQDTGSTPPVVSSTPPQDSQPPPVSIARSPPNPRPPSPSPRPSSSLSLPRSLPPPTSPPLVPPSNPPPQLPHGPAADTSGDASPPDLGQWSVPPNEELVGRSPLKPFPPLTPPSPRPPSPTPPSTPTDSLIVVTGRNHTCVSLHGKVKCFGMNEDGRLGLGDNANRGTEASQMGNALPFVDLGPGLAVVALAAGDAHTCAIVNPGSRIKCWGLNAAGQLGVGDNRTRGMRPLDMGTRLPFVNLGPNLQATAIAAGSRHTCAILQPGGRVKCWGHNSDGRLGLGDTRPRGLNISDMGPALPFVDLGPGLEATAITAGSAHTCALLQPGRLVKCWGYNHHGQLGVGDRTPRGVAAVQMGVRLPAVDFGPGERFPVAITAGAGHTCALLQPGGGVRCWGRNKEGQLSLGDTSSRGDQAGETSAYFQDARLDLDESAVAVAAGAFFTCALLVPGRYVKCWGSDNNGALGQATGPARFYPSRFFGDNNFEPGNQLRPINIGYGLKAEAVAAGGQHVCVRARRTRTSVRMVKCWGRNSMGQLGLGDNGDRGLQEASMGAALAPVDLGSSFGPTPSATSPPSQRGMPSPEGSGGADDAVGGAVQLAVGSGTVCMWRPFKATLQCWESYLQTKELLVDIGSGFAVQAVAKGAWHTCALLRPGGVVKCWGASYQGQTGVGFPEIEAPDLNSQDRGSNTSQSLPVVALGPPGRRVVVTALAAGGQHTCAILAPEGRVKCWGNNEDGRLGLGDNVTRGTELSSMGAALPFVDLGPGLTATAIAAGFAHICAVLQPAGRVKCWGANNLGQLGLGDNVARGLSASDMGESLPFVDLGPGVEATAIVAGEAHTCVLLQPGGRVKCWGANGAGQLGLGDTRPRGLNHTDMGSALPFVDLGPGLTVTALWTGSQSRHTCALLQPGSILKCWGDDRQDQLGRGIKRVAHVDPWLERSPTNAVGDEPGEMGTALQPVAFGPEVRRVKSAGCGYGITCAVVDTVLLRDQVKCWGSFRWTISTSAIRGNPDKQLLYLPDVGAIGDTTEDIVRSPLLDPVPAEAVTAAAFPSSPSPSPLPSPPPWTHSCSIVLTNTEAAVHCWPNPDLSSVQPSLSAWVGRELLNSLRSPVPSVGKERFSGVNLRQRTYPEEVLRAAEKELQQSSSWTAAPIPDMGVTFRGVPHLRIVDSVIRGGDWSSRVALQPLGPLLQCVGCPFLTLLNVTVSSMSAPYYYFFDDKKWISDPDLPVYGPIHASGLIGADVSEFTCRDITYGQGWSCLHLQYEDRDEGAVNDGSDDDVTASSTSPELQALYDRAAGEGFLTIRNSSISATETGWGGAYGTSVLFSDELYGDYDFNTGVSPKPILRYVGYGAIVVTRLPAGVAATADAYKAPLKHVAAGHLAIHVYDSVFEYNTGDYGGALSVVGSTRDNVELYRCHFNGGRAHDGAALYVNGSLSALTLRSVNIVNNTAISKGGVAYVSGSLDQIVVVFCNITNNAAARGGTLYVPYIGSIDMTYSGLTNTVALLYGGAIVADGLGDVSLAGSYIAGNRALNGSGAVLYSVNGFDSLVLSSGTAIRDNIARDAGGAVFSQAPTLNISLAIGTSITNNSVELWVADGAGTGSSLFAGSGVVDVSFSGGGVRVLTNGGVV